MIDEKKGSTARLAYVTACKYLTEAGFDDDAAHRNARDLLAYIRGMSGLNLLLHFDDQLSTDEGSRYDEAITRLADHEPIAYIIGSQEFAGFDIQLTPGVLIPRHDSLVLVNQALERLPKDKPARILELGCGSGAVILAVASARPFVTGVAIDIDPLAIETSRLNFARYGVSDRIELIQVSWSDYSCESGSFDMVLSNPPYISTEEMLDLDASVKKEPHLALWGGRDGLDCYRRILPLSRRVLRDGACCLVEIGWKQGQAVRD